jgi:hypothetical protein
MYYKCNLSEEIGDVFYHVKKVKDGIATVEVYMPKMALKAAGKMKMELLNRLETIKKSEFKEKLWTAQSKQ